jgi:hypothetical protein
MSLNTRQRALLSEIRDSPLINEDVMGIPSYPQPLCGMPVPFSKTCEAKSGIEERLA